MSERLIYVDNNPDLTVVFGPMFCGKSSQLIEELSIASGVLEQKTALIKPIIDNRYSEDYVVSHSGIRMKCLNADHQSPEQILAHVMEAERDGLPVELVGIDEIQFFREAEVLDVVQELLAHGKEVIAAGLPTDFRNKPFGATPQLIASANIRVEKFAKCLYRNDPMARSCAGKANRTQRIINDKPAFFDSPTIEVGEREKYQARCADHHFVSIDTEHGVLVVHPHNIQMTRNGIVVYSEGEVIKAKL